MSKQVDFKDEQVSAAAEVFMETAYQFEDTKKLLMDNGFNEREIDLGHKIACRNWFHVAFARRWDTSGEILMNSQETEEV